MGRILWRVRRSGWLRLGGRTQARLEIGRGRLRAPSVTQRLAIVSDIHGNLVALEAVIADLDAHAPDLIVQGGDLAVIGPRPSEVIDRIRDLGWPGVLGNTDEILFDPSGRAGQKRGAPKLGGGLAHCL